ncbi:MAG: sulfite exporter TauE/SafE family protein [Acidobacteria bacterium]|nr:sulfite exporter TauE/SafE family protein [Acidobacteriota bacterium]
MLLALDSQSSYALLVLAGFAAGAINGVAGGGSLISFPTMLALGIAAIPANATNAVALWPGSLASVWSYRKQAKGLERLTASLTIPSILGALFGAWLLLNTPEKLFKQAVPILILLATLLLCYQPRLKRQLEKHNKTIKSFALTCFLQFLVSIYGGYFGAGMGIMMLALLGFYIEADINQLNAIKTWLGTVINIVASLFFISANSVLFIPAIALGVGAILGGYLAPKLAQKIKPDYIRYFVITIGFILTFVEFIF